MKKQLIYSGFERFWHWLQTALILFLCLTGFEIHGSFSFFGFDQATRYHNAAAISLLFLIAFAIFWHLTTGEWRQYLLTRTNLKAQIEYYLFGIFRNAPHPSGKSPLSKLNPLQKIVYAGLKVFIIPSMVISGLLYMFYRYPQRHEVVSLNIDSLEGIAIVHTLGAFLMVSFIIAHVYLITTGQTVTSNLRAMLTGYEQLPENSETEGNIAMTGASASFQGERT